ncbi:BRE1 E3 ubiquitin ligase-domain-containing protein [Mucidula mucida]|nr:BRE1 E3 ubiquitin ligase-domain-containing protein [Mucidula mucida]
MASKKRSHDEDAQSVNKKRILSDVNGSPVVNGRDKDEVEDDNLELFRKEAIYRKMKHYSRELDRSQAQIQELEWRRSQCEAGLAAISACWAQILVTVQTLAKPEDMPSPSERVQEAFNISSCVRENTPDEVKHMLEGRTNATQALVSRFFQLSPSHYAKLEDPSYINYQSIQTECASLRSRVDSLATQLQESQALKDSYHSKLVNAENRIERIHSQSVRTMERRPAVENGVGASEPQGPSRNPSPPAHGNAMPNGNDYQRDWKSLAISRGAELDKTSEEIARLQVTIADLNTQISHPPLQVINEHPQYKYVLEKISHLTHNLLEMEAKVTQAQETAYQAVQARIALEEKIPQEHAQQIQDMKAALSRRDTDIARLREIRDQQLAELHERKQKDAGKMTSTQEFKALAESRAEMISVLQTQLRHCKAQLAARAGNEEIMKFLVEPHDVTFVDDLQEKLTVANEQLAACRLAMDDGDPVEEHRKTLERLAQAEAELAKYRQIYGATSMSAESAALTEELQRKEEELRRLRLEESQRAEAESSLYSELDKLSAAWESLDRQLKTKVYDLAGLEERVSKSVVERAKSDNKYYQAMREKEAIESERKNLQRVLEKQDKVMERLREAEKNLRQQVSYLEAENSQFQTAISLAQKRLQESDNDLLKDKNTLEAEMKSKKHLESEITRLAGEVQAEKVNMVKAREAIRESRQEAERLDAKLKVAVASASKPVKQSDLQMQLDETLAVLKCSTCKQSVRSIILSKCLHTFCKECIDARISTRQRKCPSCNLAFSQGDVMQMYFQ